MAQPNHTQRLARTQRGSVTVLFCLIDDAYPLLLNPNGKRSESIKRLSDSEVITLVLLQQLRGVESERSFLRDTQRFFSQLFSGIVGLHPSSHQGTVVEHEDGGQLRLEHLRQAAGGRPSPGHRPRQGGGARVERIGYLRPFDHF